MKLPAVFQLALRAALGTVFMVSGFQKLIDSPENFAAAIEQYEIVSGPAALFIARALPWAELVGGALFALGLWTRAALALLWSMSTGFIALLASALVRRLPIDQCGCLGKAMSLSPQQMLAVDAALWTGFLVFFLLERRSSAPSLDRALTRHG